MDVIPVIRLPPDTNWYGGTVSSFVVPRGEAAIFNATVNIVPTEDAAGRLTIYIGVPYSDLRGEQRSMTYLCLRRDERSDNIAYADVWSVHGVAFQGADGELVATGDGWQDFAPPHVPEYLGA